MAASPKPSLASLAYFDTTPQLHVVLQLYSQGPAPRPGWRKHGETHAAGALSTFAVLLGADSTATAVAPGTALPPVEECQGQRSGYAKARRQSRILIVGEDHAVVDTAVCESDCRDGDPCLPSVS